MLYYLEPREQFEFVYLDLGKPNLSFPCGFCLNLGILVYKMRITPIPTLNREQFVDNDYMFDSEILLFEIVPVSD